MHVEEDLLYNCLSINTAVFVHPTTALPDCKILRPILRFSEIVYRIRLDKPQTRKASGSRCLFPPETPSDERMATRNRIACIRPLSSQSRCARKRGSVVTAGRRTAHDNDWLCMLSICTTSIYCLTRGATLRYDRVIGSTL